MKILLVEDEAELSAAVQKLLKVSGYEVECAYDGVQALEFTRYGTYDCIVMDIMMPRLDGLGALAKMRADGVNTPVLLLTAKAELDDKVAGLDAGADDYLPKPFAVKELLARIRALTRRQSTVVSPYTLGNLTLKPDTFELQAVGTVRLTNKEFRLLEYLIRNNTMYLSTERIMENVWDYDAEAEINVVWVFISSLRKKMESVGADYHIKAARNVGYRLEKIND
jgi:DNA-binding response OmpR family regulator